MLLSLFSNILTAVGVTGDPKLYLYDLFRISSTKMAKASSLTHRYLLVGEPHLVCDVVDEDIAGVACWVGAIL